MKKSKSTTKPNIKTADQAKDFIVSRVFKLLNEFEKNGICVEFASETLFAISGHILLETGNVEAFDFGIHQIIENNQELFEMNENDYNEHGTFHYKWSNSHR